MVLDCWMRLWRRLASEVSALLATTSKDLGSPLEMHTALFVCRQGIGSEREADQTVEREQVGEHHSLPHICGRE